MERNAVSIRTAVLWNAAVLSLGLLPGCDRGGGGGPKEGPRDLKSLLAEFDGLAQRGLFVEAAHVLSPWIESFPPQEQGGIELKVAAAFHRGKLHDQALKHAEAAIKAGVEEPQVYYVLGDSQRALFHGAARGTLEKLLALAPDHHLGELSLARFHFRAGDVAEALKLFESYFKSAKMDEPEYGLALLEQARALRSAGRFQEAADRFAVLLEQDPLDFKLYSELASALYRLRLRKEARFVEEIYKVLSQDAFEEHIEARLREKGATALALGQEGANRTRQRRFLDAFRAYRLGVEAGPTEPRLRIFLADLSIQFRRLREAEVLLDEGLRLKAEPASGLLWKKGLVAIERGAFPAALKSLATAQAALAREGNQGGEERGQAPSYPLHLALAWAAVEAGDWQTAAGAIEAAEAANASSWEPSYWLGRLELARGEPDKAFGRFEDASRKGGKDSIDVEYYRALALARRGRDGEAGEALKRILDRHPGFDKAHATLLELPGIDPALKVETETAFRRLKDLQAQIKARESAVDSKPLEHCGLDYLELAKLRIKAKAPGAFDLLFLAADLIPDQAEPCKLLIAGLKQSQDVFVRLEYLRRLLRVEPENAGARAAIADTYLKLHVRLGEAAQMVEGLHARSPTAVTFRLLGLCRLAAGRKSEALALLEAGVKAYPGDAALGEALSEAQDRKPDQVEER